MSFRLCAIFFFWLFALPFPILAREEMPWFGNVLEFQFRTSLYYQFFQNLSSPGRRIPFRSHNTSFDTSIQLSPWQDIDTEVELSANFHTRTRRVQFNGFSLTGRYLIADDILGDPVSIAVGATLIKGWRPARVDPAVFYPAQLAGEFHISIGKERPVAPIWKHRFWGFYALGFGDVRALWSRLNLAWEKNLCERHIFRLFTHSLWGFGGRNLRLPFDGYGGVRFQAVDLGFRYTHILRFFGELSAEYSYRVHARNFPVNVHTLMFRVFIPFGL